MALEPLTAILDIGGKLIDKLFPNPAEKAAALLKLREPEQSGDLAVIAGQIDLDKIEAANPRLFVSGWRPFVGWVCASGMAMQFVVGPFVSWTSDLFHHPIVLPALDMSVLMTLLVGMLGLGGMRTIEKLNGVASK